MSETKGELNCTLNEDDILCNVIDGKGEIFCSQPKRKKDAHRLALCWNSHDELIKIKEIAYEAICTGDQKASDKAIGLIEDFEAAIAKAKPTTSPASPE